jgi:hypothetical protein
MEELKLIEPKDRVQMEESISDVQEEITIEQHVRASQGRRNPPARNTSRFWFERFLSVIQRQNPSVIDSAFLSQIAPSNEGKLLAQLKYLHVIDEQGKPTKLLPALNMVGEEQKKGFQEIAREAYFDLLGEVKIERAVPDDVVNFFIRKYTFTRDKAINAAKFFLYLAEKGSMPVSSELSGFLLEKNGSNGPSVSAPSVVPAVRAPERIPRIFPSRDPKSYQRLPQRKILPREEYAEPAIAATINIRLDKDTPREYWDRVLALLGERRNDASFDVQVNGSETPETVQAEEERAQGA